MRYHRHRTTGSNAVGALIVIAVGVMLLLNQNGILRFADLWRLWPVVFIIGGALRLMQDGPNAKVTGAVLIGVGVVLEAAEFQLIPYRVWDLWPVGIIALGLLMLWRSLQPRDYDVSSADDGGERPHCRPRVFSGPLPDHMSIFSGAERRISTAEFTRADILSIFGGYKLDLRKARMKGTSAIVEATAIFGGVEIVVPEEWNVVLRGAGIFGGYGDETRHPIDGDAAPQLIVEGVAIFGGVAIKN